MFTDLPLAYICSLFGSKTVVVTDFLCRCFFVCVCVNGRRTTTMSTQSVTARDLGGEWPSRRAPGPALDYRSQCAAQSAVSICVSVCMCVCVCVCVCKRVSAVCVSHRLISNLEFPPLQPDCPCLDALQPTTEQSHSQTQANNLRAKHCHIIALLLAYFTSRIINGSCCMCLI